MSEYLFNWTAGGWNYVYAASDEEAEKKANAMAAGFNDSGSLVHYEVEPGSLRKSDRKEIDVLYALDN